MALYAQELADLRSLMRKLESDFDASRAPVQRPVSGQYTGDSNEDDKGDQAVVSNLKFGADGSVPGAQLIAWSVISAVAVASAISEAR